MKSTSFDVLVVGGGPAGSALTLRLARAGCKVAQLERTNYDTFRVGESLPPSAAQKLKRLGVWEQFLQTRPIVVHGVQSAWGTSDVESSSFLSHTLQNGWHVDRAKFDQILSSAAEEAGSQSFRGIAALKIARHPHGFWSAKAVYEGRTLDLNARFLVDASGRSGNLYATVGTKRTTVDRLIGIALVCPGAPTDALPSLIESHPLGWWYSAGLPTGDVIAIFFTDSDLCSDLGLTRRERLQGLLTETRHTKHRINCAHLSERLRAFPAGSHCLQRASGDSWVAIGDAVIGRDPLSSSGIDFALASAERAFAAVSSAANGTPEDLDKYDDQVRSDFEAYLSSRRDFYDLEQRWASSSFWHCRHSARSVGTPRAALGFS